MRVKTGIYGLDELVGGGFPRGSFVLVTGKVGTGKSVFAMQYVGRGVQDYGEPAVFVSFERERKALYDDAVAFGWHFQRLEKAGSLRLLGGPIASVRREMERAKASVEDILGEVADAVREVEARRAAVDGLELLRLLEGDERSLMLSLAELKEGLSRLGCTLVATSQVGEEELEAVGFGGGLADGVISLYYEGEGLTRDRALEIRKMRGTVHSNQLHFFDITDKGIVVKKLPEELGKSSEGHEPKGA
jgi:KaiC/GvpD/RAD55 family RecA-like ATPase